MSLDFKPQTYLVNDIIDWNQGNDLILTPNFQRRKGAWKPAGKSYLIDTILRGAPIPPFYIRQRTLLETGRRTIREVVDGQQRLRTIIEFFNGDFFIFPLHSQQYGNARYKDLPDEAKQKFLDYSLSVNLLTSASDKEVLEIFRRINSYVVPLNAQETLNALYIGYFRQSMLDLAEGQAAYWTRHKILTEYSIARMEDVRLTSELVAAIITKELHDKKILKELYASYDEGFPEIQYVKPQFELTLQACEDVLGVGIASTIFRRPTLFYSLFVALYNLYFGFGSKEVSAPRIVESEVLLNVRIRLLDLSSAMFDRLENYTGPRYEEFYRASLQSTDKLPERKTRHEILTDILAPAFRKS